MLQPRLLDFDRLATNCAEGECYSFQITGLSIFLILSFDFCIDAEQQMLNFSSFSLSLPFESRMHQSI